MMYGREYLENKEITETVEAIEAAIAEILDKHPVGIRTAIESKIRTKRDVSATQSALIQDYQRNAAYQHHGQLLNAGIDPYQHRGFLGLWG
jgi:hypothetical protein